MANSKTSKVVFKGTVIRESNSKTRVIEVKTRKRHPKYKKIFTSIRRFVAHDPEDSYHVGDVVEFIPSRPYSRTKRFIIIGKV